MKSTHLIQIFIFLFSTTLFSQEAIIKQKERKLTINIEDANLSIEEHNRTSKLFLKNIGLHTKDYVHFSSMEPLIDFNAITKVPGKKPGKFKTKEVTVIETKDIVEPGIFYGGHKIREFVYPAVVPTAIGILDYTKRIKDPHLINSFYFDDRYQTEASVYAVSFPKGVKIDYDLFNTEDLKVQEKIDSTEKMITYSWTIRNVEKRIFNSNAPAVPHFAPHIILRIDSYFDGKERVRVSGNTDDLFKWYNTLVEQIPTDKSLVALQSKVDDLTNELVNHHEKIDVIYKWVQSNIKYIAFENGMAGFVPRAPSAIFEKKYGDCKDMANLLQTMLNLANIPAYLTWVGTNSKPYSYEDVPCTIADNHMICAVKDAGQFQFLDATNSHLEYGVPPRMIQGKEALIRIDDENYEIVKVPESKSTDNVRKDIVNLEIEGDVLSGKVKTMLSGYLKERYQYFKLETDSDALKNYLSLGQGNSKIQNIEVDDNSENVEISFDGRFKNDILKTGDKLYVNMNIDPTSKEYLVSDLDSRIHPVEKSYKRSYFYNCSLKIPDGYEVDFLPENEEKDFGQFLFKIDYKIEDGTIKYRKQVTSKFLILEKEDFGKYAEFYADLLKINQQKLVFILK